jgi:WD40 repeat protein
MSNSEVPTVVPAQSPRPRKLSDLGLESINIKKELSFGSIANAIKRPFHSVHIDDDSAADKGLRLKRNTTATTVLESHQHLNYYLAGSGDNSTPNVDVTLYQFGQNQELVKYKAISDGRFTKCHFDPYGAKFAGADSRGDLNIWKFDSNPGSLKPVITLKQCHDGAINDFAFLNSSSIIATAGISASNQGVSIWDTLLPPTKRQIRSKLNVN